MVLVGVVSGQKGGAKGAMRGNRGKVSSWQLDNFVDILMLSDFDVTCRVTKNYHFFLCLFLCIIICRVAAVEGAEDEVEEVRAG